MSKKPPKQQIHVKATRRRGQSWADFAPIEHLQQHDRKVASLRRAEAVNDASLEVTAKRLVDVFPNLGPHVAIVKAFLDKPANVIHGGNARSKMQERHQKRLRLLKAITLGGETGRNIALVPAPIPATRAECWNTCARKRQTCDAQSRR